MTTLSRSLRRPQRISDIAARIEYLLDRAIEGNRGAMSAIRFWNLVLRLLVERLDGRRGVA